MRETGQIAKEHETLTRRYFLGLSAAGLAGLGLPARGADAVARGAASLERALSELQYLTPDKDFKFFGRVNPQPGELSAEQRRAEGLERDAWSMEIVPDPKSNSVLDAPLSKSDGTAFTWSALMDLAKTRAVRLLHVVSCTNAKMPCGMGLWEGVPLRDVLWLAKPKSNIRRLFYYGFHNQDPKQIFQGSLPVGRVLEDPPGEYPVLLCYKLNQQYLSLERGGPVRMFVPGEYANKSVKWIQRVLLTNDNKANDTYALQNNDTESPMKSCARFIHVPGRAKSGEPLPVTGLAQVGMSGLRAVEYWLHPKGAPLPKDDPYFADAPWKKADILDPPEDWGGGLLEGKITEPPAQFDSESGKPSQWPLRYAIVHWAAALPGQKSGQYDLRCRTIDARGVAQPMPRPFRKSGNVAIDSATITIS